MDRDKLLQLLRECAEDVKEEITETIHIPDNCCNLDPGAYSGEELGAVIYFIADMIE